MGRKFLVYFCMFSYIIVLILCDIQAIDVAPVYKKDLHPPDFEDEPNLAAVPGSFDSNEKEVKEATNLLSWMSSGSKLDFTHAFITSLSVIIVSELGDKTFFIAAIMAMTNSRLIVFTGAMGALSVMHILSAMFGYIITYIPRIYTFYTSAVLFLLFGLKMMKEGWQMKESEAQEEMEGVQMELKRREGNVSSKEDLLSAEEGNSSSRFSRSRSYLRKYFPRVFLESFTLTFLAEWGDRSQIATVVLATSNDVDGIIVGGLLGHFLCTGLAVAGGKLIASRISVRTVTMIGGIVFLAFAFIAFIVGP